MINVLCGVKLDLLILKIEMQKRINKQDKEVAANLNYTDIVFPIDINDYEKIEDRFQMQVNVFGYENKFYPLCTSKKSDIQTLNLSLKKTNLTMYLLNVLTD